MPPQLQMVITISNGQVSVNGPLQDKGMCYMMLECARDAIKDFADKQAKPTSGLIVPQMEFKPPVNGN